MVGLHLWHGLVDWRFGLDLYRATRLWRYVFFASAGCEPAIHCRFGGAACVRGLASSTLSCPGLATFGVDYARAVGNDGMAARATLHGLPVADIRLFTSAH